MLRLPPAMRVALAAKHLQGTLLLLPWKPVRLSGVSGVEPYRQYATIFSGRDDSLRSQDEVDHSHPTGAAALSTQTKASHADNRASRRSRLKARTAKMPKDHAKRTTSQKDRRARSAPQPSGVEFADSPGAVTGDQPQLPTNNEKSQLSRDRSFDYSVRNLALPTKRDYPNAPAQLFDYHAAAIFIGTICHSAKIPWKTDVDFELKNHYNGMHSCICSLKVEISDLCKYDAVGEDSTKVASRKAAWLQILSQLHVDGLLTQLMPTIDEPVERNGDQQHSDDISPPDSVPQPSIVDKETLKLEKDAKTDIFNYAARLGIIPHFDAQRVRFQRPLTRRARLASKKSLVYQVSIRLKELAIDVKATSKMLETAEVAASIMFKQKAEALHADSSELLWNNQTESGVLTVATAKSFFDFCRQRDPALSLEIEHETLATCLYGHQAHLLVNGKKFGEPVQMGTKAAARDFAYLVAAVHMVKADSTLLTGFAEVMNAGRGKFFRPLSSIDLQIAISELETMRVAITEAHNAGLPVARPKLPAESRHARESSRRKPITLAPHHRKQANEELLRLQQKYEDNPKLQHMRSKKADLPIRHYSQSVLDMIQDNPYSIVIGATGSGKTTQVPQILFEDAIARGVGASCNVICTQPRRIAATSVAQRVASERGEALREHVGYQVRFDSQLPTTPYGIQFCTTGLLLTKLKDDRDEVFDTTSHIIIDEVHERDLGIDFLMVVLKEAIRNRKARGKSVPKIVLMSATLDSELFSRYFGIVNDKGDLVPCPSISVPGRTFPVREKYLGTIMHDIFKSHGPAAQSIWEKDSKSCDYLKSETTFSASQNGEVQSQTSASVINWKAPHSGISSDDQAEAAREKEDALVPSSLVAATIAHIVSVSDDGAILVFLPGLDEILSVQRQLLSDRIFGYDFSKEAKFRIFPLHSTMPKEQQSAIFDTLSPGCRKIILSTNIAETSITVPDIKFVVDSGKLREKRYDQATRMTRLQCVWESKSNSKQRAGRAGRVQDGNYYALFSKERAESLQSVGQPELLRSDLQETCLDIKVQQYPGSIKSFLQQAIQPPSEQAVDAAVGSLIAIEALTDDESLTSLGRVLSKLPVHPLLAKAILLGVIFRCLDPMIILGAAAGERSIFLTPLDKRAEARGRHRSYAENQQSDHLATLDAFKELRLLDRHYGMHAAQQRGRENFLHMGCFRTISQIGRQIEELLLETKLIRYGRAMRNPDDLLQYGPRDLNVNSGNNDLIKCLLVAGLSPNLGVKTSPTSVLHRTPGEHSVLIHPSSFNAVKGGAPAATKTPYGTLYAYSNLSKSADGKTLYMRDTTIVTPIMALLFGGKINMLPTSQLVMDGWLPFFLKWHDRRYASKLILEYRKTLDRALYTAFDRLSNLDGNTGQSFQSDPIIDQFARSVITLVGQSQPA